jgi:hypothetical protein
MVGLNEQGRVEEDISANIIRKSGMVLEKNINTEFWILVLL